MSGDALELSAFADAQSADGDRYFDRRRFNETLVAPP
jgi:hypothetical protein